MTAALIVLAVVALLAAVTGFRPLLRWLNRIPAPEYTPEMPHPLPRPLPSQRDRIVMSQRRAHAREKQQADQQVHRG